MSNNLHALLVKAEQYLNNGDFQQAYDLYNQLIKDYNNSPEIYNNLAIAAYQLQKHKESIDYISAAIKLDPNNCLYIAQYAQFLFSSNFNLAEQLFNQAIKLADNPNIRTQIEHNYSTLLYNQACITAKDLNTIQQNKAIELFDKSLKFNSNNYKAYFNIACCYANLDNLNLSIEYLKKTIEYKTDHADAHFALSQFYQQNNNNKLAEYHLQQSLAATSSNQAMAEYNYGVLEHKKNNYTKSIEHYQKSLTINPQLFAACYNTASIYQKLKQYEQAVIFYKKALEINPQNPTCNYLLASLNTDDHKSIKSINPITKAPEEYIEQLFDSYAISFDHDLVTKLNYQTHELLYELFINNIKNTEEKCNLNILDLGCGTGLAGQLFKPNSKTITGVDLSQKMLDIAAEKKIYTKLIKAEINNYLENLIKNKSNKYNIILLSDVLVYYGELDQLFNNIRRNLSEKNRYLLFSIELTESLEFNTNYQLTTNGRYCHSADYITSLAKNKFKIIASKKAKLRLQENKDVAGMIFLLS